MVRPHVFNVRLVVFICQFVLFIVFRKTCFNLSQVRIGTAARHMENAIEFLEKNQAFAGGAAPPAALHRRLTPPGPPARTARGLLRHGPAPRKLFQAFSDLNTSVTALFRFRFIKACLPCVSLPKLVLNYLVFVKVYLVSNQILRCEG